MLIKIRFFIVSLRKTMDVLQSEIRGKDPFGRSVKCVLDILWIILFFNEVSVQSLEEQQILTSNTNFMLIILAITLLLKYYWRTMNISVPCSMSHGFKAIEIPNLRKWPLNPCDLKVSRSTPAIYSMVDLYKFVWIIIPWIRYRWSLPSFM
jgi:hypothetical protein